MAYKLLRHIQPSWSRYINIEHVGYSIYSRMMIHPYTRSVEHPAQPQPSDHRASFVASFRSEKHIASQPVQVRLCCSGYAATEVKANVFRPHTVVPKKSKMIPGRMPLHTSLCLCWSLHKTWCGKSWTKSLLWYKATLSYYLPLQPSLMKFGLGLLGSDSVGSFKHDLSKIALVVRHKCLVVNCKTPSVQTYLLWIVSIEHPYWEFETRASVNTLGVPTPPHKEIMNLVSLSNCHGHNDTVAISSPLFSRVFFLPFLLCLYYVFPVFFPCTFLCSLPLAFSSVIIFVFSSFLSPYASLPLFFLYFCLLLFL